jgi:RNA polymerase sigma-70 factor, ECF subfamily
MSIRSSSVEESELLEKVSSGDEEAFRQLYDLTCGRIAFYLQNLLRDKTLIDDVLVETFTAVWKSAHCFKGKSKVTTWIIGIARNLAMKQLKKTKCYEDIDNYPHLANGTVSMEKTLDRRTTINKALSQLSAKHREVLDLVFFCDMTYSEIASLLHVPVNTVKTRVFYAKESLRDILEQLGGSPEDDI